MIKSAIFCHMLALLGWPSFSLPSLTKSQSQKILACQYINMSVILAHRRTRRVQ